MNFQLSLHTQEQLANRNIPLLVLQLVLDNPQQIVEEDGMKVYQSQIENKGKIQLMRAYVNDSVEPAIVVTVYLTSKINKYWSQS